MSSLKLDLILHPHLQVLEVLLFLLGDMGQCLTFLLASHSELGPAAAVSFLGCFFTARSSADPLPVADDPLWLVFRTLSQNSEMTELFPRTIVSFGIYTPSEAGVQGDPTHWLPASDSCLLCFDHSRYN